jgi:hypothetical protein
MELTVELFAQSLGLVAPQGEALINRLYPHRFQKFPAGTPLFTFRAINTQQLPLTSRISIFQDPHSRGMRAPSPDKSDSQHRADHAQPVCHDAVGQDRSAAREESVTTLPLFPMQQWWVGTAHSCLQEERLRAHCDAEALAHHLTRLSSSQAELGPVNT